MKLNICTIGKENELRTLETYRILGLKQTLAMVNDYNILMKDLPLNELMAATDMDGIKNALANIFTHMRKLRNTKYPIARALRFVEAISKDVFTQMLKVIFSDC